MKRMIKASTGEYGTWLLDRSGKMEETKMHVPSTTYYGRGLLFLAPTDAQFLYDHKKINESEGDLIVRHAFAEYLLDECDYDIEDTFSILDITKFNSYGEMRYAPTFRNALIGLSGTVGDICTEDEDIMFHKLNDQWYPWLQNNFVKVSRFADVVEFRISSTDGFNWNKIIIDDAILGTSFGEDPNIAYTIVKETSDGYRSYFVNATLNEILEADKVVLSDTLLQRKVLNQVLCYKEIY